MLLSAVSKSSTAPFFCTKTRRASPQFQEIVFVSSPIATDVPVADCTHLEIVFPHKTGVLHGWRELTDDEIVRELDFSRMEFPDKRLASEFIADLLRKGAFEAVQVGEDSFTLKMVAEDGGAIFLRDFHRRHDLGALTLLKAMLLPPRSSSGKRYAGDAATVPIGGEVNGGAAVTTTSGGGGGDDLKPKALVEVQVTNRPKKKMRA